MIQVGIPEVYFEERHYTISVLLKEILGLPFQVQRIDSANLELGLLGGKKILIQDAFFSSISDASYLDPKYLPQKVTYLDHDLCLVGALPILFGIPKLEFESEKIVCHVDLISSAFFMLSRWEEVVVKDRDKHGRFPAQKSFAYKANFLDRPLVNEYAELIWNMLQKLGYLGERKQNRFSLIFTHDVDSIETSSGLFNFVKNCLGHILRRRNPFLLLRRIRDQALIWLGIKLDPVFNFDWIMNKNHLRKKKARFYFISGGKTKYEGRYSIRSKKVKALIAHIREQGHIIGFHPSYETAGNAQKFHQEKVSLEAICKQQVDEGRHHYLRFSVPETWQLWDSNAMRLDSTCGYADFPGFRMGTGDSVSVFNVKTRSALKLKERPLVFMDTTWLSYMSGYSFLDIKEKLTLIMDNARRCQSECCVLFHNDKLANPEVKQLYLALLEWEEVMA